KAKSAPVGHLQPVHEEGFRNGPQRGGRRAERSVRRVTDAARPCAKAGVAPSGARGGRSSRARSRKPLGLTIRGEKTTAGYGTMPWRGEEPPGAVETVCITD